MNDADVIVVGGAVAGGAMANALGQRGVRTIVVEKVSREVHSSRGDVLQPETLEILDGWGVLAAFHREGVQPITEIRIYHRASGFLFAFPVSVKNDGPAGKTIAMPHDRIEALLFEGSLHWPAVEAVRGTVTGVLWDDAGRAVGVRARPPRAEAEIELRARLVIGCDGGRSLVRRELGIAADSHPYDLDIIVIAGNGYTETPQSIQWHADEGGQISVVPRPHGEFRFLLSRPAGHAAELMKLPDPGLYDYIIGRFPALAGLRFGRDGASLYKVGRQIAERYWAPGAALVGDAAHTTHPAGGSGMNLAIVAAERLAGEVAPEFLTGGSDEAIDAALQRYDAERRPTSTATIMTSDDRVVRASAAAWATPESYAAYWQRPGRPATAR